MPAAGVEISDFFVRALSFIGSPGALRVAWWEEEAIPHGPLVGGMVSHKSTVVEALKKIRTRRKFDFAHISIPEQQSYLCEMSVPAGSPEEARLAIELHLEEQVPIRAAEAVFDGVLDASIHTATIGVSRSYRVAVAQKKVIDAYAGVCADAGIAPLSFDTEPVAIARAVVGARAGKTLLIVHLSEDDTGLSVVSEGSVRFASTVPLVLGEEVAEEIARAFAGEAARVREFWETHGDAHKKIQEVVACGRGAAFPRNLSELASALHLPVVPASVWQNAFVVEQTVPPVPRDESLRFSVPIGLALRPFIYV